MAFKGRNKNIFADFADLTSILLGANIQGKNPNLYRTIAALIERSQQNKGLNQTIIDQFFGDVTVNDSDNLAAILNQISIINAILNDGTFLTALDESNTLPSSRRLVAGTGITFDDTVPFIRTISSTGGGSGLVPMTTGAYPGEIMFIGQRVMMVPA